MVKDGKQLGKTFQATLTLNRAHLKKQKQNTYSHTQELMQEVHTRTHARSTHSHTHELMQETKSPNQLVMVLAFLLALTVEQGEVYFILSKENKNIKNVKRSRDGMPKSMQKEYNHAVLPFCRYNRSDRNFSVAE